MNGARGVPATTARSSPLPLAARHEVSSFLELFEGVPASSAMLKELCEQPLHAPELCVFTLTATTRVVLQWYTDFGRRRRHCAVNIVWQEWIKADVAPWSIPPVLGVDVRMNVREVSLAGSGVDATPAGMLDLILWAKRVWKAAILGPCPNCETVTIKRLRLEGSRLCARCTLQRAISE